MKPLPFLNPAAGSPAARNPSRPAVIVPVQATEGRELEAQCAAAARTGVVDVIEWRIDPLLEQIRAGEVDAGGRSQEARICGEAGAQAETRAGAESRTRAEAVLSSVAALTSAGLPVLITLRTAVEGGALEIDEAGYAEVMRELITGLAGAEGVAGAAGVAIDIEIDRAQARSLIALAHEHGLPVVASHHDFNATEPADALLATFRAMADADADVAKVAMMPRTPADVAGLLEATSVASESLDRPVLGISMGRLGVTSRIMGADFGSCATFAQVGEASAPGQVDALRLAEILDRVYG